MNAIELSPQHMLQWMQGPQVKRLVWVVNGVLVLWLAYLAAQLTWALVPGPGPEGAVVVAPADSPSRAPTASHREQGEQIKRLHLFGEARKADTGPAAREAAPVPVEAPDTRLKLTLRGVFSSEDKQEARAIVADAKGNEESYGIDDPVPGNATLSEVYPDRVILKRAGRYETLRLPEDGKLPANSSARGRAVVRPQASRSVDPGSVVKQYRKQIQNNPQALSRLVRPQPVREGGKFVGFRLLPGAQKDFLGKVGLQSGDIVTAINGVQIDSPVKGMKALQSLAEGDNVTMDLRRDGQQTALSFQIP